MLAIVKVVRVSNFYETRGVWAAYRVFLEKNRIIVYFEIVLDIFRNFVYFENNVQQNLD